MIIFADSSDAVVITNIIVGSILTGFMAWLKYGQRVASTKAEKTAASVAKAADTVKTTLAYHTADMNDRMEGLAEVGNATHTLVNSQMGTALEARAKAERAFATVRPTAENIKAAELAEAAYAEHQRKQSLVDGVASEKQAVADAAKEPKTAEHEPLKDAR
jgi:bifunctional ADP-heptose synthase (sugar kinase/adenylyltransferase)